MKEPDLELYIRDSPPSLNKIYQRDGFGNIKLTHKAIAWKRRAIAQAKSKIIQINALDRDAVFRVEYTFFMNTVVNKSWPNKAKSRFKKRDPDNLLKLSNDTIKEIIGIDDSHFFSGSWEKVQSGDGKDNVLIKVYQESSEEAQAKYNIPGRFLNEEDDTMSQNRHES